MHITAFHNRLSITSIRPLHSICLQMRFPDLFSWSIPDDVTLPISLTIHLLLRLLLYFSQDVFCYCSLLPLECHSMLFILCFHSAPLVCIALSASQLSYTPPRHGNDVLGAMTKRRLESFDVSARAFHPFSHCYYPCLRRRVRVSQLIIEHRQKYTQLCNVHDARGIVSSHSRIIASRR